MDKSSRPPPISRPGGGELPTRREFEAPTTEGQKAIHVVENLQLAVSIAHKYGRSLDLVQERRQHRASRSPTTRVR